MSYMDTNLALDPNTGIQELSLNEIDEVNGALGPLMLVAIAGVAIVGAAFVAGVIDGASGQKRQAN